MAFYSDINYLKLKEDSPNILEDEASVFQAIFTLFKTKKGTRVFRPTYGANLSRYLFEPCDEITASNMMYDITQALESEPRVELDTSQSVVIPDPVNRRFEISLYFTIPKLANQIRHVTLVFKQDKKG